MSLPTAPPLALYVHIPWCVRKCPYCDFNSHTAPKGLPQREYVAALLADLDLERREYASALAGREIVSVFFGGGTPSLFAPDAIAAILDGAAQRLPLARDAEITLETNPGTVEHGRFDGYLRPFHIESAFDYVASGAWKTEPQFQRFLQARHDRLQAGGRRIDLWK